MGRHRPDSLPARDSKPAAKVSPAEARMRRATSGGAQSVMRWACARARPAVEYERANGATCGSCGNREYNTQLGLLPRPSPAPRLRTSTRRCRFQSRTTRTADESGVHPQPSGRPRGAIPRSGAADVRGEAMCGPVLLGRTFTWSRDRAGVIGHSRPPLARSGARLATLAILAPARTHAPPRPGRDSLAPRQPPARMPDRPAGRHRRAAGWTSTAGLAITTRTSRCPGTR